MKIKKEAPAYDSIEDRTRDQRVNREAKQGRYKEDPEALRTRLEISNAYQGALKGKRDKEQPPLDTTALDRIVKDIVKNRKKK